MSPTQKALKLIIAVSDSLESGSSLHEGRIQELADETRSLEVAAVAAGLVNRMGERGLLTVMEMLAYLDSLQSEAP